MASILIVEDEKLLAKVIKMAISSIGHQVIEICDTGEEAVALSHERKPELVLMDINLKGDIDGIEAAEKILGSLDIPVIFITAYTEGSIFDRAKKTQPYGYLVKPVNQNELIRVVETSLYKHKIDKRIRESEEKHRLVLEHAGVGIGYWDLNGRLLFVNRVGAEQMNMAPEDYTRKSIFEIFDETTAQKYLNRIKEAAGTEASADYEDSVTLPTGIKTFISNYASVRNASGEIVGVQIVSHDITLIKEAQLALQDSEAFLNATGRMAKVGGWELDAKTKKVRWTKETYHIHELPVDHDPPLEEAISFFHPDDRPKLEKAIENAIEHREPYDLEVRFRTAKGRALWTHTMCEPVIENGKVAKLRGTFQDITDRKEAERVIEESRKRFHSIFEACPVPITLTQMSDGKFMIVNQAFLETMGYKSDEIVGLTSKQVGNYVNPRDRIDMVNELLEFGRVNHKEIEFLKKDGSTLWGALSAILIKWNDIDCVLAVTPDISEVKSAENRLRQSEDRYRLIAENTMDVIWQMDLTLSFVYVNPAIQAMTGYTVEEWLGSNLQDHCDVDNFAKMAAIISEEISKGPIGTGVVFETIMLKKNQEPINVEIHGKVNYGNDGKPIGLQGVTRDITERKHAQTELIEAEEKYRLVVENANEAIFVVQDGCFMFVNSRCAVMTGYKTEELLNMEFLDLIHPENREEIIMRHRTRIEGDTQPYSYSFKLVNKEGIVKWINLNSIGISWHGKPAGLCCATDISDIKKAEELALAAERLKAVGELASGVAHNFNNLLQIVLGGAQLAIMDLELGNSVRAKENLERIVESSKFGADTIRRLQEFAKVRKDVIPQSHKIFDLANTVDEAIEMSKPWWKTKPEKDGITVNLNRYIRKGCFVEGNENELFEVAVNLIKNAAEALEHGGEIKIRTAIENDSVVLIVEDNGIGLSEENVNKVFEPFWTTKGPQGTGMGLSSSYGIVQRHNGDINIESELGVGAKFTVRLPLKSERPEPSQWKNVQDVGFSYNVLVVDDMPAVVKQIEGGLATYGQNVYSADSGLEALEVFKETPMDVVICDLAMPEINGWQVGEEILKICKQRNMLKPVFIMLTGWGGQIDEEWKMKNSGVDVILEKPVDIRKLIDVIDQLTQESRA